MPPQCAAVSLHALRTVCRPKAETFALRKGAKGFARPPLMSQACEIGENPFAQAVSAKVFSQGKTYMGATGRPQPCGFEFTHRL